MPHRHVPREVDDRLLSHPGDKATRHPRAEPLMTGVRGRTVRATGTREKTMALYVVYRKAAETPTEVRYRFGSSATRLDRELVIEKVGPTATAMDGKIDQLVMTVARNILAKKGLNPNWPGGGGIQA